MAEIAPGFYVDDRLPAGKVYTFHAGFFLNYPGPVVAIHPVDWQRIPGAERERFLDGRFRADSARGLRELEGWLRGEDTIPQSSGAMRHKPGLPPVPPPSSPFPIRSVRERGDDLPNFHD